MPLLTLLPSQLTATFIWFAYPESAGLTLEQTGLLFVDGWGVRLADELRKQKQEAQDIEGSVSFDEKK